MTRITKDNWKDFRESEANRLFSTDMYVQYTRGFMRFDDNNFGRVTRITKTGSIYVAEVHLKEVRRDCDQGGGWIDYDSTRSTILDDRILRFLPRLCYDSGVKGYGITWKTPEDDGRFNLRSMQIGRNGLVRATLDSLL